MKFIKKILISSIIVAIVLGVTALASILSNKVEKPIIVKNINDLDNIRNNLSGYYLIDNDIDAKNFFDENGQKKEWVPIGTKEKPFTGKIDFNYHNLTNLTFSSKYIKDNIENSSSDEIAIGFLGYSEGIIMHSVFYRVNFPNLNEFIETDKNIVYGSIVAVNNGYVTSSSVQVEGDKGTISFKNGIFGSAVGINRKQVLICKSINTLKINIYGDAVCGGLIGLCDKESVNSSLFRGGYLDAKSFGAGVKKIGGLVGKADSCDFNDLYVGSVLNSETRKSISCVSQTDGDDIYIGGIFGTIEGTHSTIKNCYVCNNVSFKGINNIAFVGGMVGYSLVQSLKIKASVSDLIVTNSYKINTGIAFGKSDSLVNIDCGLYTIDLLNENYVNKNNFFGEYFKNISLEKLDWPTNTKATYWTKENKIFYLNIL